MSLLDKHKHTGIIQKILKRPLAIQKQIQVGYTTGVYNQTFSLSNDRAEKCATSKH